MSLLQKNPFYSSVFGGLIMWFFVFLITPVSIVNPLALETIAFAFLNVMALVIGYVIVPKKKEKTFVKRIFSNRFIYTIIAIVIVSFGIRYIDLCVYRELKITNTIAENRRLAGATNPNFIFIIASVLKQFFFIPVVLYLSNKKENKLLFYFTILLFLLPFLEGYMRGSRNSFFFSFVFLLLILFYFKKISFNKQQIAIYVSVSIALFVSATSLVMQREGNEKKKNVTILIDDAIYSDFLKTHTPVKNKIISIKKTKAQQLAISALQFGQYYTHGFFEFDNLVKHYQQEQLQPQKGKYMFFTITKFLNKYNLTKVNLDKVQMIHPRGFTFITLFGGLYLDFWWFSLIFMLIFGMLQKKLQQKIRSGFNEYMPLFIFFLFLNFFMFTFNFIRGQGTYNVIVCLFLILAIKLQQSTNFRGE